MYGHVHTGWPRNTQTSCTPRFPGPAGALCVMRLPTARLDECAVARQATITRLAIAINRSKRVH
jgi:hypothetical protein